MRLTGVCHLHEPGYWQPGKTAVEEVLLRDGSDVAVVAGPPIRWSGYLATALGAAVLIAAGGFLWGDTLRRRVRARTAELSVAMEELRAARTRAEEASAHKIEFLANMSHEIRTPRNGIPGMTELALDTPLTDDQRSYLSMVHGCGESLQRLLNGILDLSKIEAGKLNIESTPFRPRDFMAETLAPLRAMAAGKGLAFTCGCAAEVPEELAGDAHRLRQMVNNLAGNAIKFRLGFGPAETGLRRGNQ